MVGGAVRISKERHIAANTSGHHLVPHNGVCAVKDTAPHEGIIMSCEKRKAAECVYKTTQHTNAPFKGRQQTAAYRDTRGKLLLK